MRINVTLDKTTIFITRICSIVFMVRALLEFCNQGVGVQEWHLIGANPFPVDVSVLGLNAL